ncbi:MAG: DnaB-like helicase N-terminal domain-containing protein, partial [Acidobacteriota bacterium]
MAPMKESTTVGLGDWLSLETSVLRTLCLTINAEGSELKYRILDSLSEEDFYFPINKAVFSALKDIHRQGDYLVSTTLEEALRARSVDIPGDCFLEDLFRGGLPELPELSEWLSRMKGRGRGVPRAEKAKSPPPASAPSPLRSTPPRVQPVTPAPVTEIRSASDARKRAAKALDSDPAVCKATPPPRSPTLTLASEAEDWASYLNDLAAKQGKSFETGFAGLDEMAGGLST